ncbi:MULTISPECIES: S1 family peptidase [unclassified Streptosporangium]|uniref:S1 family peptidase n=1 Tax=unclassified Streptosporangium TaxID=2632669 RepID=UPI002E284A35|nr:MULTISPECIES: S1 family peptidase [unclassified Streptosporangium]
MIQALQRDLGLSKDQAEIRLVNEARLAPIEAKLRDSLGDRFGGSWLSGTTARSLVVATTSAADIPAILAAGAQAEVVTRSLAQLIPIKQSLDAALPARPRVGSVRYIDVRNNKVVILSAAPEQAEAIIETVGVNKDVVSVIPSFEIPRLLGDVRGGDAYYTGITSRCSIGFAVTKGAQRGFVSAGHCGKKGAATVGADRTAQGIFQGSVFPGSDYAWIAVNTNWTLTPTVSNGGAGIDESVPVAGARAAIEGASVCRSGSTTDWHCGLIQQRDASVTYPQGNVFELTRTSVCAEPGDSGGSFISIDQAQGVTSGGSGDCSSGGTTYFQPIGEILTAYGLKLLTATRTPPTTTSAR